MIQAMWHLWDSPILDDKQGRTWGQVIQAQWFSQAARGNLRAIELVVLRLAGQPPSHMTLAGSVEIPSGERVTELVGRLKSLASEEKEAS